MKYNNVYFIIGTAYAGKSTMIKKLSEKYNGILCEENYHDRLRYTLDKNEYPGLCYTRDLVNFSDFIRRTPDEYEEWIKKTSKECEKLELIILDDLIKNNIEDKKIFVDTNISINKLKEISDIDHVLVMVTNPEISVNRFFEREDKEKQFLYQLLLKEKDVEFAMNNFKECLKRINNQESYNEFINSGFNYIIRDDNRTIDETLEIVEKYFKLK